MLIDLGIVHFLIIFVHITQSKVYLLRDYDDEPIFIEMPEKESVEADHQKYKPSINQPKMLANPQQAVLHYGRHIYHLDSFEDLTKLRSKMARLNPDFISYFDLSQLANNPNRNPKDYIHDLLVLTAFPKQKKCKNKDCEENSRKYNSSKYKYKTKYYRDMEEWRNKRMPLGRLKRFQIIDNRKKHKRVRKPKQSKNKYTSSEEYHKKRKVKPTYSKKKKYTSDSDAISSESKESKESREKSRSREKSESRETREYKESKQSSESTETWKNKHKTKYESESRSSEEESVEFTTRRPKKKHTYYSESRESYEDRWKDKYSHSSSEEEIRNTKKKKYAKDINRKTFGPEELFMQGNKLYSVDSDLDEPDKRRRLPSFLPKRFHWEPSQIHELGYYWFNGPKGKYPDPKSLLKKKK